MSDTPNPRRYRRRNFSEREMQERMNRWRAERWGPFVLRWMEANDRDVGALDTLELATERMEIDQRHQSIRDLRAAARATIPKSAIQAVYQSDGVMTTLCLMLLLDSSFRGILEHLNREFPDRALCFDKLRTLPNVRTLHNFQSGLSDDDWKRFLSYLFTFNSGLALILEQKKNEKRS